MLNVKLNKKKGFTLIELVIVVTILVIISSLAIPLATKYINNSKEAKRNADFETVYNAVNTGIAEWKKDGGTLPSDFLNSTISLNPSNDSTWDNSIEAEVSSYVEYVMPGSLTLDLQDTRKDSYKVHIALNKNQKIKTVYISSTDGFETYNGSTPTYNDTDFDFLGLFLKSTASY